MSKLKELIVTFFYLGKMPFGGTFASLGAMLVFFLLNYFFKDNTLVVYSSIAILLLASVLCLLLGDWAERYYKKKDPGQMVLDEVAGYFVSVLVFVDHGKSYLYVGFLAFLLFRVFDVMMPYPIAKLEKLKSGYGMLFDDIGAGIYAMLILNLILYIWG